MAIVFIFEDAALLLLRCCLKYGILFPGNSERRGWWDLSHENELVCCLFFLQFHTWVGICDLLKLNFLASVCPIAVLHGEEDVWEHIGGNWEGSGWNLLNSFGCGCFRNWVGMPKVTIPTSGMCVVCAWLQTICSLKEHLQEPQIHTKRGSYTWKIKAWERLKYRYRRAWVLEWVECGKQRTLGMDAD